MIDFYLSPPFFVIKQCLALRAQLKGNVILAVVAILLLWSLAPKPAQATPVFNAHKLSGDLIEGGGVSIDCQISPDGEHLVYRANIGGYQELFAVLLKDDRSLCVPIRVTNGKVATACL